MREWTLHPSYLDRIGKGRCWSEGLGGIRALLGIQKMHRNHSALERFKATGRPLDTLAWYLAELWRINDDLLQSEEEKDWRQAASLDRSKLDALVPLIHNMRGTVPVTSQQVAYEQWFLWTKLRGRDNEAAGRLMVPTAELELHPLFYKIQGPVEPWERVK